MERSSFEQWRPREVARLLALVETERRYYQEMVAALPVALAVLTGDRTVVSANRAFRHVVELRYEDLRQKTIEQILPSDELIERIRLAHVEGDSKRGDIKPFLLSMGVRHFRIAIVPIRSWEDEMEAETLLMLDDVSGVMTGVDLPAPIEIVVPATEPEPAPAIVPGLDLTGMPAILWQADASSLAFTYVGGAVEELLGFTAEHWLTTPQFFTDRIHPDDRHAVLALFHRVAADGGEATAEYRAVSAAGSDVWCRETLRVPAPGQGQRIIAGVLTGIAQRRQLETQRLTAGRVDALRHLSARLAHDLNNPLMIVTGYGEEILNSLPPVDVLRDDVTEMLSATGRITELAGHLLSFTREHANPGVRISLQALLTGLEPRLREQVGENVDLAIDAKDVWAFADPQQLEDAILSFAAVAMTATDTLGQLRIACDTSAITEQLDSATLKPATYAVLAIQASGTPTPQASEALESFLPAKDPRHSAEPAAARAYLNVRQWGGDVLTSSGTFGIYLPYAHPDPIIHEEIVQEEVIQEEIVPEEIVQEEPPPLPTEEPSRGTIMIVEDEPGIRALVRKILRRERYEVLEAGNGEQALEISHAHFGRIDLLLTDVMLPGMNGRALAEKLLWLRGDMKVIYVSGYTDDEAVRTGDFPPGSVFLSKPFTLSALTDKVRDALET